MAKYYETRPPENILETFFYITDRNSIRRYPADFTFEILEPLNETVAEDKNETADSNSTESSNSTSNETSSSNSSSSSGS